MARAALLVYHDSAAEGTQSPAGWAYAAVRTAKRLVGVLDTVLVTNRAKEPALAAVAKRRYRLPIGNFSQSDFESDDQRRRHVTTRTPIKYDR